MTLQKAKGPLPAKANPLDNQKPKSNIIHKNGTSIQNQWQVLRVANRYRLPPQIAGLICDFQKYGEAA